MYSTYLCFTHLEVYGAPVGFIGPSATTEMVERGAKVYKTVVIEDASEMLGLLVSESSEERWCFEHEQVRYVRVCENAVVLTTARNQEPRFSRLLFVSLMCTHQSSYVP